LLIKGARQLFNRKGYATTTTREIADAANVAEPLIFRNFGSKAELFREAIVQPFVEAIDRAIEVGTSQPSPPELTRDDTREFVAVMYDVFHEHRALAAIVFAADALVESKVVESDAIDDVRAAIDRFVAYASMQAQAHGRAIDPAAHSLAIRGHMAMVAGIATFGSWYFGGRRPSRRAVIDEMSHWIWLRYSAREA
jgi:AcrR family transcriptional regulator